MVLTFFNSCTIYAYVSLCYLFLILSIDKFIKIIFSNIFFDIIKFKICD